MKMRLARLPLIFVFLTSLTGCAAIRGDGKLAPPGRIIAISLFKCNCDPIVQEAIQDSLVYLFFTETNAKPVKGENGDITIVGIITMDGGQTGTSKGSVLGIGSLLGGSASGSSASGNYVTGIAIQAYKNGELIATNSVGQDLGGGTLISPVTFAQNAAWEIVTALARQNEIGYK